MQLSREVNCAKEIEAINQDNLTNRRFGKSMSCLEIMAVVTTLSQPAQPGIISAGVPS